MFFYHLIFLRKENQYQQSEHNQSIKRNLVITKGQNCVQLHLREYFWFQGIFFRSIAGTILAPIILRVRHFQKWRSLTAWAIDNFQKWRSLTAWAIDKRDFFQQIKTRHIGHLARKGLIPYTITKGIPFLYLMIN